MFDLITFVLLVIGTEAITEILVKSELFKPFRKLLFEKGKTSKVFSFFHELLDCGYCTSVWVALLLFLWAFILPTITKLFCLVLVIHRCSNITHFVIDRLRGFD